ncbi:MAG: hypothetical protein ACRENU_12935 [Gemmatimonadaceae bacterium]
MVALSLRASLLGLAVVVAGCNSSSEPQRTYNLCVHLQGAAFIPGSTGDDCDVPQTIRAGQSRTVVIEADKYLGDNRTGFIEIDFAPNGWTVNLGGGTILVPGQQTLTFDVPATAVPGDYQIAVRANSNGEIVVLTITIGVSAPV